VKLSDVERKPPDILSDLSETDVYCLSKSETEVYCLVKWKTNLSVDILLLLYIGMQVNFGLEISMNDTNYLISS
jgi:hypothetical protein